jgi:CII-binding regulator of phage lambda lysogenization HflD
MTEAERDNMAKELLSQTLKDLGPQLAERAKAKLTEEMMSTMGWVARDVVKEFAIEWMRENVIPELLLQLEANKPQLVAQLLAGVHAAVRQLAVAMEQTALKNLQDYRVRQFAKDLFGP